jgi:hypothetical protein
MLHPHEIPGDAMEAPEVRAETLSSVAIIRSKVGEALFLELREGQASAEGDPAWDDINNAKWAAYQEAAEVLPNGEAVLANSEDAFLALLQEFESATNYQIAQKVSLPW